MQLLEKTIKTDLSIIAYLASIIEEAVSEKSILIANDVYTLLHKSLMTYQIVENEDKSYAMCVKIFNALIAQKYCQDPNLARKKIIANLKSGMTVMAKYTEDEQWYGAKIDSVTDTEVKVTYTDYGNTEWVDALSINIIEQKLDAIKLKTESNNTDETKVDDTNRTIKQGVRIGDKQVTDDVSAFINSQLYQTSRFLTDTVRGQQQLAEFGLTSRQKKKAKKEFLKKEKVARFDPCRYLKSIRQKARPEWFDVKARKCTRDVVIENYTMSTLDDKHILLQDVDIKLAYGQKFGFIGLNGSGKTTLLRRMSRYDIPAFPQYLRILHVEQEVLGDETKVLDYVLSCDVVRKELLDKEQGYNKEKALLDQRFEVQTNTNGEAGNETQTEDNKESEQELDLEPITKQEYDRESDRIANSLAKLYEQMRALDVLDVEPRAKSILSGLGFTNAMMNWPTNRLSGGWRMRVSLAGALFVSPDILLLDEPTNHLDFPSVIWLEKYLQSFEGTVLVVSHDREFLNNVAATIIHLDHQSLVYYKGNFSTFLDVRKRRYQQQLKEYTAQQDNIAHIQSFIDKFRYNAKKASMVQSRIKTLQNMERIAKPEKPFQMIFDFPACSKLDDYVVSLRNVTFGYNSNEILLNGISCFLDQKSRVGVIGANGSGKTTLINLMINKLNPLYGEVLRNRNSSIAVFTQHHMDQLDLSLSAVDYLLKIFKTDCNKHVRPVEFVRTKLGKFGLSGELVEQRMVFLSGGQKSRVAFTVLTWKVPHFIIMDEPTNHLDVETIEGLINAIERWNGGLLVVSHDQHFLNSISKEYWALSNKSGTIRTFMSFHDAKQFAIKEA